MEAPDSSSPRTTRVRHANTRSAGRDPLHADHAF
jgi:hypothetical protein